MMKTILITGGSGYLGTVLVNKLVKKNYKIINLDPMIFSSSSTYQKTHKNVKTYWIDKDKSKSSMKNQF